MVEIRIGPQHCSGSLIADRVVLTAAHCLAEVESERIEVALPSSPPLTRGVRTTRLHPAYDPRTLANDLALAFLDPPVPLALTPLPLRSRTLDAAWNGRSVRFVGFGGSSTGTPHNGRSRIGEITPGELTLQPQPALPCGGDSGAPILVPRADREKREEHEEIIGVVSGGDRACTAYARAIRVDVNLDRFIAPFVQWATSRELGLGERCFDDHQCASGLCQAPPDAPRFPYCTAPCTGDAACPAPLLCDAFLPGARRCQYPLPSPGAIGARCAAAADCTSGLCVRTPGGRRACTRLCLAGGPGCPAGTVCLPSPDLGGRNACLLNDS